jgi:hypothetical protein
MFSADPSGLMSINSPAGKAALVWALASEPDATLEDLVVSALTRKRSRSGRLGGKLHARNFEPDSDDAKGGHRRLGSPHNQPGPDVEASGWHTVLTSKVGRKSVYTQGWLYDQKGRLRGRTDVTDHGRPESHPPGTAHYHKWTWLNGAKRWGNAREPRFVRERF